MPLMNVKMHECEHSYECGCTILNKKIWQSEAFYTILLFSIVGNAADTSDNIKSISSAICDAIWETIHKVGRLDFKIFMALHRGGTEEYSEKIIVSKAQFYAEVLCSKGQSCKKLFFKLFFKILKLLLIFPKYFPTFYFMKYFSKFSEKILEIFVESIFLKFSEILLENVRTTPQTLDKIS